MNNTAIALSPDNKKQRQASFSTQPSVLTDIYKDQINLAVWQNPLTDAIIKDVEELMAEVNYLKVIMMVTSENIAEDIAEHSSELKNKKYFCQHIATLVDMFCTLFETKEVGLRLSLLDKAMCPKFHVDHIPCRLVSTFSGIASEWLPHQKVNRSKLGAGSEGKPDDESGIMQSQSDIQHLSTGDVALLKGEGWYNNEDGGLVHRSPALNNNEQRLLLTLDFID